MTVTTHLPIQLVFEFEKDILQKITMSLASHFSFQIEGDCCQQNEIENWLNAYLSRKPIPWTVPLHWKQLPPFTRSVLAELQNIPLGQAVSYGELAQSLGKPQASRALGNACGRNPFPFVIPCHRVLAKGGKIGGFSNDLAIKRLLLDFEAVPYQH